MGNVIYGFANDCRKSTFENNGYGSSDVRIKTKRERWLMFKFIDLVSKVTVVTDYAKLSDAQKALVRHAANRK